MIAVMHGDLAKAVYCHWDGYVAHNGYILQTQYDSVKANKLVALGDLSSLGADIGEQHDFGRTMSEDMYVDLGGEVSCSTDCTFYGRDRGEENCGYEVFHSLQTLLAEAESRWAEYVYILKGNEWFYSKRTVVERDTVDEDGNKEFQSIWTPLESLKDALLIQKELFI
jgi:hypothetical protein